MDCLQDYELMHLLDNLSYAYKNEWEIARYGYYFAIAPYSKKKYSSIEEFFPLGFDKEVDTSSTEISNEDIERLKQKSEDILKQLKSR